jgi:hypothetical protein
MQVVQPLLVPQAGRSAGASYSTLIGFNVGNGANLKVLGQIIYCGTNISLVEW